MAILRMLQFMEAGEIDFNNNNDDDDNDDYGFQMDNAITEMRENTRALLAKAKRESDRSIKDRPSVDELREQGKLLSFVEVAKVCQRQVSTSAASRILHCHSKTAL